MSSSSRLSGSGNRRRRFTISSICSSSCFNPAGATNSKELEAEARRAAAEYRGALRLLRPTYLGWTPPVRLVSALEHRGLPEVWAETERFRTMMLESGELERRRAGQARSWLWNELSEALNEAFRTHPSVASKLDELEAEVLAGRVAPSAAARQLLDQFLPGVEGRKTAD